MSELIMPVSAIHYRFQNTPVNIPMDVTKQDRLGNVLAMLVTNEHINSQLINEVSTSSTPPNGYIVGVGAGTVFRLIDLFPAGQTPRGIICTDIVPEVVLVGRALEYNIKKCNTMEEAVKGICGFDSIPTYYAVIRDEKNPIVRRRMISAIPYVVEWMKEHSIFSRLQDSRNSPGEVLRTIKRHFNLIKSLALEGKINFAYTSFIDPDWISYVKKLPDWDSLQNIVYISNIIDHITQRGTHMDSIPAVNTALSLFQGNDEYANWYVDTQEHSMNYQLRVRQQPPVYSGSDFI